jgi:chromosome segregation ATPase
LTESKPSLSAPEAAMPRASRKLTLTAAAIGLLLIGVNIVVLLFVVDKERVYAERENAIQVDRSRLDAETVGRGVLADQRATLEADIGRKRADLDALKGSVIELQAVEAKLENFRAQVRDAQEATRKATSDKAAAEADRDAAKTEIARLVDKANSAKTNLAALQDQEATLKTAVDQLVQSKSAAEQSVKSVEGRLAQAQSSLGSLQPSVSTALDDLQKAKSNLASVQAEQQISERRRDAANQETTRAQDLAKAAEQSRAAGMDAVAQLSQQEQTLKVSIPALTSRKTELDAAVGAQMDRLKDLAKQQDDANANMAASRAKVEALKAQADQLSSIKSQIEAAQAALAQKQSDLAKAALAVADVQAKASAVATLEGKRADLESQNEKLKADGDQLTRATAGRDELEKQRKDALAAIGEASAKLQSLQSEIERGRALIAEMEVKKEQQESLEAGVAELSKTKDELSGDVAKLRGQAEALRHTLANPNPTKSPQPKKPQDQ